MMKNLPEMLDAAVTINIVPGPWELLLPIRHVILGSDEELAHMLDGVF